MFLTPFLSNTAHFKHLTDFIECCSKKLHISIFLCTLTPDFQSVATVKPLMNFVVLINQILSVGGAVESESLNCCSRHIIPSCNEHFTTKSWQFVVLGLQLGSNQRECFEPHFFNVAQLHLLDRA